MKHWLPFPLQSLLLLAIWLLLNNSVAPGQWLLGALFALLLPRWCQRFPAQLPPVRKPLALLRYLLLVLGDIIAANLLVARQVLGPNRRLRPAFLRLPLELRDDFAITLLASTISLTPGTVSADLSADRRSLLIHALHTDDPAAAIAQMKQRYETPLKEIFGC
jgi:multicomponent K+:H+ antiporter subunit E